MKKLSVEKLMKFLAEFFGTFGLTLAVLAVAKVAAGGFTVAGQEVAGGPVSTATTYLISIPIIAAFTLAMFVLTIGKISGTHVNPAVTLGAWSLKKIRTKNAIGYIIFQILGAFSATKIMNLFSKDYIRSTPFAGNEWYIFWAEVLGALIFGFGIAAAIHHERSDLEKAAIIGGSLFLGTIFASFAVGGGVLNPAVASAIYKFESGVHGLQAAYIFGPILGMVLGMNFYTLLTDPKSFKLTKTAKSN